MGLNEKGIVCRLFFAYVDGGGGGSVPVPE